MKKQNDEHTNEDGTEDNLIWKTKKVQKPELIYISSFFTLDALFVQ